MPKFTGALKEHWEKGATVVALAFETAVAFERRAAEVSLETRFIIAGIAGLAATLSVAEMLRFEPKRSTAGFHAELERATISAPWVMVRVILICLMSTLSVFLLNQVTTFHNIRLMEEVRSNDRSVGTIEIRPAHTSTNLTINLSTSQINDVRIVDKAPASWNNEDPVDWRMQNDSPYGVTLFLKDFKSPQVFGCWYRLSGAEADELEVDVTADPAEVRVLRRQELSRYRRNVFISGGLLCVAGLVFWSFRSSWFRLSP